MLKSTFKMPSVSLAGPKLSLFSTLLAGVVPVIATGIFSASLPDGDNIVGQKWHAEANRYIAQPLPMRGYYQPIPAGLQPVEMGFQPMPMPSNFRRMPVPIGFGRLPAGFQRMPAPAPAPLFTERQPLAGQSIGSDDYLGDVTTDGVFRWPLEKLPIKVYIAPGEGIPGYRPSFPGFVRDAFDEWVKASDSKLAWQEVRSASMADITVNWTNQPTYNSKGFEAGKTLTLTGLNRRTGQGIITKAKMAILTQIGQRTFSDFEVWKTVLHEAGHAFGLQGHSPDGRDIMYFAVTPNQKAVLSSRDVATIQRLYQPYPNSSYIGSNRTARTFGIR